MGVASVVCRGTVSALLLAVQLLPCAEIGVGGSAIHNKKKQTPLVCSFSFVVLPGLEPGFTA